MVVEVNSPACLADRKGLKDGTGSLKKMELLFEHAGEDDKPQNKAINGAEKIGATPQRAKSVVRLDRVSDTLPSSADESKKVHQHGTGCA